MKSTHLLCRKHTENVGNHCLDTHFLNNVTTLIKLYGQFLIFRQIIEQFLFKKWHLKRKTVFSKRTVFSCYLACLSSPFKASSLTVMNQVHRLKRQL